MSAEQFLDQVEKTGLLDDAVVAQMRKQMGSSSFRVTAEAVAEMLVKNGYLTKFQASKLLTQTDAGAKQESPKQRKRPEKPPAAPDTVVEGVPAPKPPRSGRDDIGLAPLDGEEDTPPASAPVQEEAQDEVVMLEDASEGAPRDPGLAPLDKPKPAKPQATPGLEPISGGGGLEPIGGTPGLEPVGGTSGLEPIAGTPGLEPVEPPGVPEPRDQASGLDPIDGGGLESLDATAGLEPIGGTPGLTPTGKAGLQLPKKRFKKNVWDSKLLLVGGGALGVLILVGVVLFFILKRETAAEMLEAADEDYRSGAYAQAINKYERYLKRFPDDPNVSKARVRIGTAQLWQLVDSRDKRPALEAAGKILPQIENEDAFGDARAELATILPDIAEGFSSQAKAEADIDKAQEFVDLAKKAMAFVDNPSYIPTSLRKTIENRINAINEDILLAERNINRTKRLDEAVVAIRAAADAGNTVEAYQKRRELLGEYPELEQDPKLLEAVQVITEKERGLVKAVEEAIEASSEDHPAPSDFQVALASRKGEGAAGSDKQVMFFLARGAVYGLQATTGKVLWRRFVGHETLTAPQPLSGQIGAHVIAVDSRRNELLRLNDQTGELEWRLPVGEPFSDPVIHGKNVLLATGSGQVISVDSETGQALKHIAIPQRLQVSPGTSKLRHLYQPGEHSNLYVLDEESLECKEVYYLGHKPGTIEASPVMALGHLFVAVNSGEDYCDLNVLAVDENGLSAKPAMKPIRLKGRIMVTPILTGARVIVVTDLGAIHVFEVNAANPDLPVQDAVEPLVGSFSAPLTGYPVLDGGRLFVGDNQFTKYEVQTSRNKLLSQWIKNKRDIFVGPPHVIGDTVYHLRRRQDSPSYTASAVQADDGKVLWEVDLATPAALLAVDLQKKMIHSISAGAELFEVTTDDFQVGTLDEPAAVAIGAARTVAFSEATPMDGDRWAFTSPQDRKRMVVYDPKSVSATGRLQARAIKAAGDANSTAPPVYFDGGLLLPLDNGQVVLVDPETGDSKIQPFQARLEGGMKVQWRRPAVIGSDGKEFVIADNRQKLYRVGIKAQGQPHLAELAQAGLEVEIVSALAAAGDTVYGVVRGSGGDTVVSFAAADLSVGTEWALEGRIVWGPEPMGDVVLMASDQEGVLCFETGQKQRWTSPLTYGALAGRPLEQDSDFILTSVGGVVWRVSGADGTEIQKNELGEPLGGGAVPFGSRLLLSGSDGTLHVVSALSGT